MMTSLKTVSDTELVNRLYLLVKKEKRLTLEILPHLAEVGARGLYLSKGYGSLYEYCKNELGYTDASAWRRVRAALAIQRCPGAFEMLSGGHVTMCTLGRVHKFVTPEILEKIRDKSLAEVELLAAVFDAKGAAPDRTRPVMVPKTLRRSGREQAQQPGTPDGGPDKPRHSGLRSEVGPPSHTNTSLRGEVGIVDQQLEYEKKWKIEGTVSSRVKEKLDRCKSLLSNKYPEGVDYDTLFDELTEMFLDRKDPQRKENRRAERQENPGPKAVSSPNSADARQTRPETRYIPQRVRERVWARDEGKCTFVGSNGKRCNSNLNLQFDHYPIPFARGGPNSVDNLRLLCTRHNNFTAQQVYGKRHMDSFLLPRGG